jgi:tRNA modification GTPase
MVMNLPDDTIVAIATPPGQGGVGIVRLSGSRSLEIAKQISHLSSLKPRHAHFSKCFDESKQAFDEGVLLYFQTPHSYTGEDVIEFQMHGSPWVLGEVMRLCQIYGARIARPGEFTERAFLNEKMDLLQAEAVSDLIQAQSEIAARMASRTLQGQFSEYVHQINHDLVNLRMYVESTIDFSDEAIEWLEQHHWQQRLNDILSRIHQLKQRAYQGSVMQNGLRIVLAGRPNAGKSTLMNALVEKDIAIVTDIAGTTRDVMKESVLIDGIPVTLIDTAGLRLSDDVIEQEGIKRAWNAIKEADLVLFLHDATQLDWQHDSLPKEVVDHLPQHTPLIHVFNKSDQLKQAIEVVELQISISAKTRHGIEDLKQQIRSILGIHVEDSDFIARKRHLLIFDEVETILNQAIQAFLQHQAPELLAEDLRGAHQKMGQITGEFSSDDLLGEIFSNFCIGK